MDNKVVIVLDGHHRVSAIHIHVSISPKHPSHPGCQVTLSRVPCSTCTSSLIFDSSNILSIFNSVTHFLLLGFKYSSYVLNNSPLSDMLLANIFSESGLFSHPLDHWLFLTNTLGIELFSLYELWFRSNNGAFPRSCWTGETVQCDGRGTAVEPQTRQCLRGCSSAQLSRLQLSWFSRSLWSWEERTEIEQVKISQNSRFFPRFSCFFFLSKCSLGYYKKFVNFKNFETYDLTFLFFLPVLLLALWKRTSSEVLSLLFWKSILIGPFLHNGRSEHFPNCVWC